MRAAVLVVVFLAGCGRRDFDDYLASRDAPRATRSRRVRATMRTATAMVMRATTAGSKWIRSRPIATASTMSAIRFRAGQAIDSRCACRTSTPRLRSPCAINDLLATDGAASADQAGACPTGKIAFTQAAGGINDGSNEFCLPKGDAATLRVVKRIASTISCGPGRGRAGCDPTRQDLCFFPSEPSTCTSPHGPLTDAAWAQHCQIATLPAVPQIVYTFFE